MPNVNNINLDDIEDSPHSLELLLGMEDVLDSLDLFCYKNWYKGQVVSGPHINRYWIGFILKYDYDKMPNPQAIPRMMKYGLRVKFEKANEEVKPDNDILKSTDKTIPTEPIWLVHIDMPRRLVSQISGVELGAIDDNKEDVDMENVEQAKDQGLDDDETVDTGEEQTTGDDNA